MNKKEMAEVFADFVNTRKDYCGKSESQVFAMLKKQHKKEEWEDEEGNLKNVAVIIFKVAEKFCGKGPYEIETDLDDLPKLELEDYHVYADRLKNIPWE